MPNQELLKSILGICLRKQPNDDRLRDLYFLLDAYDLSEPELNLIKKEIEPSIDALEDKNNG